MSHCCFALSFVAEPPKIVIHPQEIVDVIPGKPATFTVQAIGTEPLCYHWKQETGVGGLQLCDLDHFPEATSSTLTIPSVQKSNEGRYYCTVSNCAGSETSKYATLSVGESLLGIVKVKLNCHKPLLNNTVTK